MCLEGRGIKGITELPEGGLHSVDSTLETSKSPGASDPAPLSRQTEVGLQLCPKNKDEDAAIFGLCLSGAKVLWHHLQIEGKTGPVFPLCSHSSVPRPQALCALF